MIKACHHRFDLWSASTGSSCIYHMVLSMIALSTLVACDKLDYGADPTYPKQQEKTVTAGTSSVQGGSNGSSLIGDLFEEDEANVLMVAVNGYLWRASLDTLSFMPLSSADPFGGVIITDWYSPPETPEERFKVTAYILDRALRSDGIRVSVFRQTLTETGSWANVPVYEGLASDLENTILSRARELKVRAKSG